MNSAHKCSCEYISLELENLTFVGKADQDDYIDIDGGKDHLIIMRKTKYNQAGKMGIADMNSKKAGYQSGNVGKSGQASDLAMEEA